MISLLIRHSANQTTQVNLERKNKNYVAKKNMDVWDEKEGFVIFKNGELLCGQLDKDILGGGKNNLFQLLLRDYGYQTIWPLRSHHVESGIHLSFEFDLSFVDLFVFLPKVMFSKLICRDEIAGDRMSKLARLSSRWIGNHGFSIGIEDVTPGTPIPSLPSNF